MCHQPNLLALPHFNPFLFFPAWEDFGSSALPTLTWVPPVSQRSWSGGAADGAGSWAAHEDGQDSMAGEEEGHDDDEGFDHSIEFCSEIGSLSE